MMNRRYYRKCHLHNRGISAVTAALRSSPTNRDADASRLTIAINGSFVCVDLLRPV